MTTLLPLDQNSNPIPALRLKPDGAHTLSASSTAVRNAIAFSGETSIISIYASVAVYIRFGDNSVTATTADHYFPAGVYYDISIGDDQSGQYSHISVLRADSDGPVYISEKI